MSNEDKQMTINNLIDEVFAKDREITELREKSGEYAMTIGRQAKEIEEANEAMGIWEHQVDLLNNRIEEQEAVVEQQAKELEKYHELPANQIATENK